MHHQTRTLSQEGQHLLFVSSTRGRQLRKTWEEILVGGTDRQITSRQTERDELTADKEKFDQEQQVATEYLSTLNQQWTSLQADLSKLYQQNVALEGQLNEVNSQLTETLEANAR